MKIAIIGANSHLAKLISCELSSKYQIVRFARESADRFFKMETASVFDFSEFDYAIHFEFPSASKYQDFPQVLQEFEVLLSKVSRSSPQHILVSTLSSHKDNKSIYSSNKGLMEEVFLDYNQSVIRIGIVDAVSTSINPAYRNIRIFLKYFPLKVTKLEKVTFYITKVEDLVLCLLNQIESRSTNFRAECYSIGPIDYQELQVHMLSRKRVFFIGSIKANSIILLLNRLPGFFSLKDKLRNFFNGMELKPD
jgi:hypothetical protein